MMTLLLALALPGVVDQAQAAQTGNLRGYVVDEEGAPLQGATAVLSGPGIAGEVTATTDEDGAFNMIGLPVGTHALVVAVNGRQPVTLQVTVRLDETAIVPVTLVVSASEIVVQQFLPVLDPTRSAVSTEFNHETLQHIPLGNRTYQEVTNLVSGVHGRVDYSTGGPGTGNPSVRGEGEYGNNYLVDGISTRDPANKKFGVSLPYDAIESVQVSTDGAPAEFGQMTGMVVNVVTRDGGDTHTGTAAYLLNSSASGGTYRIADLAAHEEVETPKRDFLDHTLIATVGGPILPERVWYFGALDLGMGSSVPEGGDPLAPRTFQRALGFAKGTWFVNPALTLRYQVSGRLGTTDNVSNGAQYDASAQSDQLVDQQSHILSGEWLPTANGRLEVKALYQDNGSLLTPASGDMEAPQVFDRESGLYTGNALSNFDYGTGRAGASAVYTHLAQGSAGTHLLKAGLEHVNVSETRRVMYTGPGEGVTYFAAPSAGRPCVNDDYSDCAGYREYADIGQDLAHSAGLTSVFVQDDWTTEHGVTLNAGLRYDREALVQNTGLPVLQQNMPAPRLGLAWDASGDSRTVVTAHVGRYYDVGGTTLARWGDTLTDQVFRYYGWDADTETYDLLFEQDRVRAPYVLCTEESLATLSGVTRQTAEVACGGDLQPYHMDKAMIGVKREWIPGLVAGVRGMASVTSDIPDDISLNGDTTIIANMPNKSRDYRAVEVMVERAFRDGWQVFGSYTLSQSRGTSPGQFETSTGGRIGSPSNDSGVFGDDINDLQTRADLMDSGSGSTLAGFAGLGTTTDEAGNYGYLPYQSLHVVKLSGAYTAPFGTTFGAVYEFDSGHAWQKRGFVANYGDYFAFPQGRGSRTMPSVQYLDISVNHTVTLAKERTIVAGLDIFNPLDWDSPISAFENDTENFGLTMYRQAPRAVRLTVKGTY